MDGIVVIGSFNYSNVIFEMIHGNEMRSEGTALELHFSKEMAKPFS